MPTSAFTASTPVDLATGSANATFGSLLEFRLDSNRRWVAEEAVDARALTEVDPHLRAAVGAATAKT